MPTLVVLVADSGAGLTLGSEVAGRLAGLGVTNLVFVRDEQGVGYVLEGWAFDAHGSVADAVRALRADLPATRTMTPGYETEVSASTSGLGSPTRQVSSPSRRVRPARR